LFTAKLSSTFIYFIFCFQNKFGKLLNLLPELNQLSSRGEEFLYFEHIHGNAPTQTLLMEMLHAKRK
jgi:hypothetical protein